MALNKALKVNAKNFYRCPNFFLNTYIPFVCTKVVLEQGHSVQGVTEKFFAKGRRVELNGSRYMHVQLSSEWLYRKFQVNSFCYISVSFN